MHKHRLFVYQFFFAPSHPSPPMDPAHAFSELKKESWLSEKTTSQSKGGTVDNQIKGRAGARVGIAILAKRIGNRFEWEPLRKVWAEQVGGRRWGYSRQLRISKPKCSHSRFLDKIAMPDVVTVEVDNRPKNDKSHNLYLCFKPMHWKPTVYGSLRKLTKLRTVLTFLGTRLVPHSVFKA